MTDYIVYDAGALIAAERNNRAFLAKHDARLQAGIIPLLPAPVLSQAWAPGGRHYGLHHVISGCRIEAFSEHHARDVAILCRESGHPDVVDGFVVLTAIDHGYAPIVTDDLDDIQRLIKAASPLARVAAIRP